MLNSELQYELQRLLPDVDPSKLYTLQCSSSLRTGAIIFHVYSGRDKYARLIVKTPRDPWSNHSLTREWEYLTELHERRGLPPFIMEPVDTFKIRSDHFFAYSSFAGRTMFAHYRNRILQSRERLHAKYAGIALRVAKGLHSLQYREMDSDDLAEFCERSRLDIMELAPDVSSNVIKAHREAEAYIQNSNPSLTLGLCHGDFSPYNIVLGPKGSTSDGLLDWEHATADQPQFIDIFRFLCSLRLMGEPAAEQFKALAEMVPVDNPIVDTLLIPWSTHISNSTACYMRDGSYLKSLWILFLLHAAIRERQRLQNVRKPGADLYLPALTNFID